MFTTRDTFPLYILAELFRSGMFPHLVLDQTLFPAYQDDENTLASFPS